MSALDRRLALALQLNYMAARVCTWPGDPDHLPGIDPLPDAAIDTLEAVVGELTELVGTHPFSRPPYVP